MIPPVGVWRLSVPRLITRAWAARVLLVQLHTTVAAVAVACVLLLPRWYTSSVTLVPSSRDGLSLDLTGGGAPFAGSMFGLGSGPTPQDQLRAVVRSRAVADSLVLRFGLRERWRLQRHEDARRALARHTTITTPREGEVHIDVEARDPVLARDLAAGYARYGGSESIRLKASLATQRRTYLEGHMAEVEREILAASARLRSFEEEHGAVSLPDQARETIDAISAELAAAASQQLTRWRPTSDAIEFVASTVHGLLDLEPECVSDAFAQGEQRQIRRGAAMPRPLPLRDLGRDPQVARAAH